MCIFLTEDKALATQEGILKSLFWMESRTTDPVISVFCIDENFCGNCKVKAMMVGVSVRTIPRVSLLSMVSFDGLVYILDQIYSSCGDISN
jgi:hypothetical protein